MYLFTGVTFEQKVAVDASVRPSTWCAAHRARGAHDHAGTPATYGERLITMRALFDRGLRLSAGRGATFEQKVESAMGRKRKEPTPAAAALAGEAQAVPPADAADEEVEEVVVGAVAVDPGGDGAADEEQPPNGYDSDKEEVPLEIEEDTVTHEDDADDASELTLEEAEAAIAADAVAAASMSCTVLWRPRMSI